MANTNLPISQLDPISSQVFTGAAKLIESYLGPMPQMGRIDPYQERNVQFFTLPDAKKGESAYLGQTVIDLLHTVGLTEITRSILPLYPYEGLTVHWEQFILNAHLLELNPYTTRAHAVTQKRNINRANLVRRGIEAEFEGDFLKTDRGRASFLGALRQITNATKQTMHYDGLRALINCHRRQNHLMKKTTPPGVNDIEKFLDVDIARFAGMIKEKNFMAKLHTEANKEMEQRGGEADTYIMDEEVAIYQGLVRDEVTDYYIAGQDGPDRINKGLKRPLEPRAMVVDCPVIILKKKLIQGIPESEVAAASRVRQIGEYYKMMDNVADYTTYTSKERSILIYDHDVDDMVEITLEDAIYHNGAWDGTGKLRRVPPRDRNDANQDFMTVVQKDGKRSNIANIYDMDPAFLRAKDITNAGKAILGRLRIMLGREPTEDDFIDKNNNAFTPLATSIMSVLGIDTNTVTGQAAKNVFANANGYAAVARGAAAQGDPKDPKTITSTTLIESKINPTFHKMLLSSAPASKRQDIEGIINNANLNIVQKTDQVRDKIIEYTQNKVAGCLFTSEKEVHDWHKDQLAQYNSEVEKAKQSMTPSTVSADAGKIVGYVKVGTDLSGTGLVYVDAPTSSSVSGGSHQQQSLIGALVPPPSLTFAASGKTDDRKEIVDARVGLHKSGVDAEGESPFVRGLGLMWTLCKFERDALCGLARANIPVPVGVLLFRPHEQVRTTGAIKAKSGGGTGYTFYGNSDMRIAHTVGTKMCNMHFTIHHRSVVMNPQNVLVLPDLLPQEYLGGGGSRFWSPETYKQKNNEHLQNSLMSIFVPLTERKFAKRMDVSGRFFTENASAMASQELHYSTADRYSQIFGWRTGQAKGTEHPMMTLNPIHNNMIVCEGHHQEYNKMRGEHSKVIVGKGHWGMDTYAGCAAARSGKLTQLRQQNYATRTAN